MESSRARKPRAGQRSPAYGQLIARRDPASYSVEDRENIALISLNTYGSTAEPYGSAAYRMQPYPADLDLAELVIAPPELGLDEVVSDLIKSLKHVVRQIDKAPLHYLTEIKCGIDPRYDIPIGQLARRKWIKRPSDLAHNLAAVGLPLPKDSTAEGFDQLSKELRDRRILRWSAQNILDGFILSSDGSRITLKQALTMKAPFKIDMITIVDGRWTEVTNFITIVAENKAVNIDYNPTDFAQRTEIYRKSMREQIDFLFGRDKNYFKGAKRMWAYARNMQMTNDVVALAPLIAGPIAMLYQLKAEIDAIILVLERAKSPPAAIKTRLGEMHPTIARSPMDKKEVAAATELLNRAMKVKMTDGRITILQQLSQVLHEWINLHTISALKSLRLFPPPPHYLPGIPSYVLS